MGLLASARTLQVEAGMLPSLLDALPWPALTVDECGFLVLVNRAMREHRGLGVEPCVGSLSRFFPDYHGALAGQSPWLTPQEVEITRESAGTTLHERIVVRRMPGGALVLVEDLTRLRELEASDAQTARLASLGFLLAGACHEIGNPLSAIYSMVQLLQGNPKAAIPEIQKGLAHIAHDVQRLLEISQRLCGFSRAGEDTAIEFPVDESIEESLALLRQSGQLAEVELVREADPEARVLGRQGPLREVFHNILLNAIQAMEGRGRLLVRTARTPEGSIEVAVHDSGPGIPARALPRIFEPFFSTKPSGKGTGLGLAISDEIVHAHQGRIRVENDARRGAWFFVVLPAAVRSR